MSLDHALLHQRPRYPGSVNPDLYDANLPINISGCVVWLDCNPQYLFKDAGKTVKADTNADLVYTWADRSGNGNDAVQATEGSRPAFTTNAFNTNKPTVRFASSKRMVIADSASYKAGYITVFLVAKNPTNSSVYVAYPHAGTHTTPYFRWVIYRGSNSTTLNLRIDSVDWNTTSAGDLGNMRILSVINNPRNPEENGLGFSRLALREITYPNAVGLYLGSNIAGNENFSGDISELIIYSKTLTQIERGKVTEYLYNKWGF